MHIYETLLLVAAAVSAVTGQNTFNKTVSVNAEMLYLLPEPFVGNASEPFYSSTTVHNSQTQSQLTAAKDAAFISYDQEFLDLLGPDPVARLVAEESFPFADEMGVWVSDSQHNEVWMASPTVNGSSHLWVLDLATSQVSRPNTSIPVVNPNGGYFYGGKVYIAGDGDADTAPCIYAVDPATLETSIVVNSYFGLRFNGPNDVTVVERGDKGFIFFTDDPLSVSYNGGDTPQIPDAVWRFDPQAKSLVPVIDNTDLVVPNGIRVNSEQTKLYVTNTPPAQYAATASSAIYVFDLDEQAFPSNKRLFGIAERGIPDGIHIDDDGRVWTGESDGVVVRNSGGKVIGLFNSLVFLGKNQTRPLQNFALAGDKLVILALNKIYVVKLARAVVSSPK